MTPIGSTIAYTRRPLADALLGLAELGFTQVDLLVFHGWAHLNPADLVGRETEQADRVAAALAAAGVRAAALNAKQTFAMNTPDADGQRQNLREHVALGRFARALGVRRLTLQPGAVDAAGSFEDSLRLSIEAFRRCVEAIAGDDLIVTFEPHSHSVAETYEAMGRYLDEVPGLRVCYDPSHFVAMGWSLADSAFLFPHAGNVHLRDASLDRLQMPWGEGSVDLDWVLDGLRRAGYDGTLSIEYFPNEHFDPIVSTRALKQRLDLATASQATP